MLKTTGKELVYREKKSGLLLPVDADLFFLRQSPKNLFVCEIYSEFVELIEIV
jgi:hypothetical protein